MTLEPEVFDDNDLQLEPELLHAWPDSPPPPGLADRVLAHCEPARAELRTRSLAPLTDDEDPPVMQPTPLRHPSHRSLLMPVALGFAAAAAMLLAFYLGRGSAPDPAPSRLTPTVELNVATPAPAPTHPAPAVPAMPPKVRPQTLVATAFADGRVEVDGTIVERDGIAGAFEAARKEHDALQLVVPESLGFERVTEVLEAARGAGFERVSLDSPFDASPSAPAVPSESKTRTKRRVPSNRRRNDGISADLKNPFGDDSTPVNPVSPKRPSGSAPSGPAKDPFGSSSDRESGTADLENPFASERGALRIGTDPGEPPAKVEIDGKNLGKTPLARVLLSAGKHTVVFHWPDGTSTRQTVTVDTGKSHVVRGHR